MRLPFAQSGLPKRSDQSRATLLFVASPRLRLLHARQVVLDPVGQDAHALGGFAPSCFRGVGARRRRVPVVTKMPPPQ